MTSKFNFMLLDSQVELDQNMIIKETSLTEMPDLIGNQMKPSIYQSK